MTTKARNATGPVALTVVPPGIVISIMLQGFCVVDEPPELFGELVGTLVGTLVGILDEEQLGFPLIKAVTRLTACQANTRTRMDATILRPEVSCGPWGNGVGVWFDIFILLNLQREIYYYSTLFPSIIQLIFRATFYFRIEHLIQHV
jgi:hypothetical protein